MSTYANKDKGEGAGGGKTIDLGRKMGGAEIKAKPSPEKYYPSMHVDGLDKDSPLIKKDVGEVCDAGVQLKVTSKSQNSDGKWSVCLEAQTLKLY